MTLKQTCRYEVNSQTGRNNFAIELS